MQGTVGAVALDTNGTIAAATSTGGLAGKLPGRVGDSALIGCGTYAESSIGGVSCTGDGEAIMRVVLARRALDDLKEADDPEYAARVAVDLLVEEGRGHGGLILLDWRGRLGWGHPTPVMPVPPISPAFPPPPAPLSLRARGGLARRGAQPNWGGPKEPALAPLYPPPKSPPGG